MPTFFIHATDEYGNIVRTQPITVGEESPVAWVIDKGDRFYAVIITDEDGVVYARSTSHMDAATQTTIIEFTVTLTDPHAMLMESCPSCGIVPDGTSNVCQVCETDVRERIDL